MLRIIAPVICLVVASPALAGTLSATDIREVQTDSTDVFEVLTILRDAEAALTARDYDSAQQGFERVLMHDSKLESARTGLRRTYIAQGKIDSARTLMTDPLSADGLIIRIRAGEIDNPITYLTSALKADPDARLWSLLGQLQDARGEFSSARQSYAMAGLAGARAGLAENNIGQSHWLAGEYELALSAFTKAVALAPRDTLFDNNRRRALVRLGQTHDAIAGLDAKRAGLFLAQAGDKAVSENEIKLAKLLYRKSLEISPRHNPVTAEKLAQLNK